MTTAPYPNNRNPSVRPTPRCFRHSVWMAYCGDCRDAHAPILRRGRESRTDAAPAAER